MSSEFPWHRSRPVVYTGDEVEDDPSSETAVRWASSILGLCLDKHHGSCPQNLNVLLPDRILDLTSPNQDPHNAQLVNGEGRRGKYVTLSHRWGDQTRSNQDPQK
jgi:hypothetical protein